MGGSGYHKMWNEVKTIIARYAYYLNLACNPEFKKKEYIRKIFRIMDNWKVEKQRYISYLLNSIQSKYNTPKSEKYIDKVISNIGKYKIDWLNQMDIYNFFKSKIMEWEKLAAPQEDLGNYTKELIRDLYRYSL
jgi:hypothetical protein